MNTQKLLQPELKMANAQDTPVGKQAGRFHGTEANLMVGKAIAGYTLDSVLGSGGMGVVYEATHKENGSRVAVKICKKMDDDSPLSPARIVRKASAVAGVNHPNVIRILDTGIYEEKAFIVMELLKGQTLESYLAKEHDLSWESAKSILSQTCAGLEALHKAGIIHMDVKPANLFLTGEGVVKVFDLDTSLLKLIEEQDGEPKLSAFFIGSPRYTSPEQTLFTGDFDHRVDVYSLGVVIYEMVSGRHPFSAEGTFEMIQMHREEVPAAPSMINPTANISSHADVVVMKALQKEPALRFQTMEEMREAILEA